MRLLVAIAAAAFVLPAGAHAATFYVSPNGSDTASGRSSAAAWRTVARVDRARLAPGDRVLFAGGARFAGTLSPASSGTAAAPIVFGSYGAGRAAIASRDGAVWLPPGVSHVRFDRLDLTTGSPTGILASAAEGPGSTDVSVTRCLLHDTAGSAVLVTQPTDSHWVVADDTIRRIGDSGIISLGSHVTIARTRILDTGTNAAIAWDKHGIYAKGPFTSVEDDVIDGFQADGVSLRFRGDVVRGTRVAGGPIGIAFLAGDPAAGWTTIAGNRIDASRSAIYVAPADRYPTRESFTILDNVLHSSGGNAIDVEHTSGSVAIHGNTATGTFPIGLAVARPDGTLTEGGNRWVSTRAATYLVAGRTYGTVAGLRASTGLGAGDILG